MMCRIVYRVVTSLLIAVLVGIPIVAQDLPRTPSGQPDLQGVWDFRTITPMERPEELAGKPFLTAEEAAEIENIRALQDAGRDDEVPADIVGNYNTFWFDRGTSVIGTMRTSLVVDPPNGRIPALTPGAERARVAMSEARQDTGPHEPTPGGWVDDLGPNGLQVRCVTGFNSGPPMTPGGYNNNVQIFQTADTVVLYNEMNHNPRVVPLDGRPHTQLRQWTGESRGYWDGDSLIVETKNFLRETSFMRGGASAELEVTERFTRVSAEGLLYSVTVNDPLTWTQPWTYEVPMVANPDPIYEYACHEGNYSMEVILAGAREKEASERSR
tara:strand:+ start:160 stop:1140 length:981 start_codon:yes stop_codon:yes gene_type:complete